MPFKSKAQRRKFAQLLVDGKISNETFEEWNAADVHLAARPSLGLSVRGNMNAASELFEAILADDVAWARRVIDKGTDVNDCGPDRFTPLMMAAAKGNPGMIELLILKGGDVTLRNDIGQTALMVAAQAGHKPVVQALIVAGSDLRALDDEQRNAISWSVAKGDFPETVSLLAVSGADYDNTDSHGFTPLMRAALMGFDEAAAVLLTVGADERLQVAGKTAFQLAKERGHAKVCSTIEAVLKNRPKGHKI